ncbi:hypothetical protein LQ567_05250 [Niabella pedocola]|uniref:Uncharacterized protein n=1 Tax=Niabella pedocola TaxID=1752077 RepID=A0ABS8PM34_9BACT|nr:hypothetical protein [Niabella pedocola]MCD2422159.1 hypothetical protein [Niabella pedocola]
MRIFQPSDTSVEKNTPGPALPVLFTGNAISHLSSVKTSIDIAEWKWHEEIIDGRRTRIVTDKLSAHFDLKTGDFYE